MLCTCLTKTKHSLVNNNHTVTSTTGELETKVSAELGGSETVRNTDTEPRMAYLSYGMQYLEGTCQHMNFVLQGRKKALEQIFRQDKQEFHNVFFLL